MPGVPSGRGCEACRKQKKKCDQARPACARCARLGIACVGAGVKRFQFKEHRVVPAPSWPTKPQLGLDELLAVVRRPPILEAERLSHSFVRLFMGDNLRYDMNAYGLFLHGIPRRLGHSKTLDASAFAVTKAHHALRERRRQCPEAVSAFIKALSALRVSLNNPATATSAETLCSIYLILICQGWLDPYGISPVKHGEAMAYVLQQAAKKRMEGKFEQQMIVTLTIPVFIHSFLDRKVVLGAWLEELVDTYLAEGHSIELSPFPSCHIRNLTKIPRIVRDPARHLDYVGHAHQIAHKDVETSRQNLAMAKARHLAAIGTPQGSLFLRIWGLTQLELGTLLCVAILYAGLLAADDPNNAEVTTRLAEYRQEALMLSRTAACHRPLGTSYMCMVLLMAWATSDDPFEMEELWNALVDYASDFPEDEWKHRPMYVRGVFDSVRYNSVMRLMAKDDDTAVVLAEEPVKPSEECVIL